MLSKMLKFFLQKIIYCENFLFLEKFVKRIDVHVSDTFKDLIYVDQEIREESAYKRQSLPRSPTFEFMDAARLVRPIDVSTSSLLIEKTTWFSSMFGMASLTLNPLEKCTKSRLLKQLLPSIRQRRGVFRISIPRVS